MGTKIYEEVEKNKGEYADRGEYHRHLDPSWSYYPIYIRKLKIVEEFINSISNIRNLKVLDAGCGEGILVEKYRKQGIDIIGLDSSYESDYVEKGDVLNTGYKDNSYDIVFFLDVIEHLCFVDQEKALKEIKRILKPQGYLILSVPNLSHLASRWSFLRNGRLKRTANIHKHPGDRPIKEYMDIFNHRGYKIVARHPIQLTLPVSIERFFKMIKFNGIYEKFIYSRKRNPDYCFLNVFILKNEN